MGKSSIGWTDYTFNPAWGCSKVSPGCRACYADTLSNRYGHDIWGFEPDGSRKPLRTFGDKHWDEPLKWDAEAERKGVRYRVFCASMADVFEEHPDWPPLRERLWKLIEATPNLDWLLLTKRPEYVQRAVPYTWLKSRELSWPKNVWVGTSAENQEYAARRIPVLLDIPAPVRFVSAEPLLGFMDLRGLLYPQTNRTVKFDALTGVARDCLNSSQAPAKNAAIGAVGLGYRRRRERAGGQAHAA